MHLIERGQIHKEVAEKLDVSLSSKTYTKIRSISSTDLYVDDG